MEQKKIRHFKMTPMEILQDKISTKDITMIDKPMKILHQLALLLVGLATIQQDLDVNWSAKQDLDVDWSVKKNLIQSVNEFSKSY